MRFLGTNWKISLFFLQLYLSTMVTLMGTEESGHCREGETSQSECMHCPPKRMAVVEGLLSLRGGCLWRFDCIYLC